VPRHKTWGPDPDPDSARSPPAERTWVEAHFGQLDPTDPGDQRIIAQVSRARSYVVDPDGSHFYVGGPGVRISDIPEARDCPHCGSVVLPGGGYASGHVQATPTARGPGSYEPAPDGVGYVWVPGAPCNPEPTEDTCAHCHRSGLDSRIVADEVADRVRLLHLLHLRGTITEDPMSDQTQDQAQASQAPAPGQQAPQQATQQATQRAPQPVDPATLEASVRKALEANRGTLSQLHQLQTAPPEGAQGGTIDTVARLLPLFVTIFQHVLTDLQGAGINVGS
jgi:hypothetical protein